MYNVCPESKDAKDLNMYNIFNLQKRPCEWIACTLLYYSWNQFLYPWVIEVCRLPFEPGHAFFLHLIIVVKLFPGEMFLSSSHFADSYCYRKQQQFVCEFPLDVQLLRWEIVWRNAPHFWRDFGSALPFQTRLTQTKPVLPLSKEHGSQVKDQGRRQFCHNKLKNFPYRPTRDVSLLSGQVLYC